MKKKVIMKNISINERTITLINEKGKDLGKKLLKIEEKNISFTLKTLT